MNNPTLCLLSLMADDNLFKDMNYNKPKPMSFEEAKKSLKSKSKIQNQL